MEVKPSHIQTEIVATPTKWRDCDISDLCQLQRGFDLTEATRKPGEIPVYSSSGVSYFHSEARLKPPAVITGRKGMLGKVFFVEEPCWPHDTTLWVKDFKGNLPQFVALFLGQFRLERFDAATSVPTLNRNNVVGIPVKLPPLPEQHAITEALSDVDGLLGGLDRLIAKKRDLKQAAMQQLLTGQTRLPGFRGEWEVKTLGAVFDITAGKTKSAHIADGGDFVICDMGSVSVDGRLITSKRTNYKGDFLLKGDLVMPKDDIGGGNIIGRVGYIDCALTYVLGDHVYRLRAREGDPLFLCYLINSHPINSSLRKKVTGSAQLGIGRGSVETQEISLPILNEQIAIAEVLSEMDAELAALEQRREKTLALKQAMMQELLTGRIRLVSPAANVIPTDFKAPASQAETKSASGKSHNWAINEAVVVAVLAKTFGSEQFPLGRKRCTKLSYLLHRHVEHVAEGYLKKPAGPYNPAVKYQGPEGIAQKNGYIRAHKNGPFSGYIAAEKIAQAEDYFQKWYGQDVLRWLEQFRRHKNDDLELLATVDMAMEELHREGKEISLASVRNLIASEPEWVPKLDRAVFSDPNITAALTRCSELFPR